MPTRALPLVIVAIVAAGFAVYQNRDQVLEIVDRGRRKIKEFAEKVVEDIERARQQRYERPHEARRRYSNDKQDYFDIAALRKENEAEGVIPSSSSSAIVSGHLRRRPSTDGFRQRSTGVDEKQAPESSVLFDASANENRFPLESLSRSRSRRSSSATLSGTQLFNEKQALLPPPSPPPLPPREQIIPPSEQEKSPQITTESEAISHRQTAIVTSRASSPPPATQVVPDPSPPPPAPPSATNSQILPPFQSNPHWSIHEWQQGITSPSPPASPSIAGSAAEVIDDNLDVMSEFGSDGSSEAGWTEVGSSVSGDD